MIKVGVVFGGNSVEHEVSIISAVQAMNKLDKDKYEVVPIYINKENKWYTGAYLKDIETFQDMDLIYRYASEVVLYKKNNEFVLEKKSGIFKKIVNTVDVILPIVHGTNVEDGNLQGYFNTIGIPYAGPYTLGAALGQDKVVQKMIYDYEGINNLKFIWFYDFEFLDDSKAIIEKITNKLKLPVVVKPATLGSSVGISYCREKKELKSAIEEAIEYDSKILVEKALDDFREINISILGDSSSMKISPTEEIIKDGDVLTYDNKYINGAKKGGSKGMLSALRKIPAKLDTDMQNKIEEMAKHAFLALDLKGVARFDFMISKDKVYLNEVNTIPGSLSFYLWDKKDIDYEELLDHLINVAIKNYRKKNSKTHSFKSNILKSSNLKGSKLNK